jgi:hypothetical protein
VRCLSIAATRLGAGTKSRNQGGQQQASLLLVEEPGHRQQRYVGIRRRCGPARMLSQDRATPSRARAMIDPNSASIAAAIP